MAELHQLEFFLLRYVGDPTRGERINLGVVAVAANSDQVNGFADVRFVNNWARLRCFDPLVDPEELLAIENEIRRELQDPVTRAESIRRLNDSWSNAVRFERLQGCLTESPALEMDRLCALYLAAPLILHKSLVSARQQILNTMRSELDRAGVLPLLRSNVPAAEFTMPGDPLIFDFGYASGETLKLLQAVPLQREKDIQGGTNLAGRFLGVRPRIREKLGLNSWLTAVVDDDHDATRNEVKFMLHLMDENGIAVARASEMHRVAEGIRLELLS